MTDFKPVELHTKRFFRCPTGCEKECVIEHLFESLARPGKHESTTAGPWYCDVCFLGWSIKAYRDGRAEVGPAIRFSNGTRMTCRKTHVILEIPPLAVPIRLKVSGFLFDQANLDAEKEGQDRFHYEENTCPTNYFRAVEEIEVGGDTDPHGLAKYIATYTSDAENEGDRNEQGVEGSVPPGIRALAP